MWRRAWCEAALEGAGKSTFCSFFVPTRSLHAALGAVPGDLLATPSLQGWGGNQLGVWEKLEPSPPRAGFFRQPLCVEPKICCLAETPFLRL